MSPRDVFPGSDDLVNINGEPDDEMKALLGEEVGEGDTDQIEPVMDE